MKLSPQHKAAVTPSADEVQEQRVRWNRAFTDPAWRSTRFNSQPNALLIETVGHMSAGLALDMHMGEGRNALYLAQLGWHVTGVDIAEQALHLAQQQAQQLGLQLNTVEADATQYDWGTNYWDLIVLAYADESTHVAQVQAALKPGGLVVFENFHADINRVRPGKPGQTLGFATDELKNVYAEAGFRILRYEEPMDIADFSLETHRLVKLVAQKR
ncbi:class I SAM-dependent methyltransferase [Hymenobacter fodinae]|uniref:Class I SAM-dependent methyltransferase n=1 Tax=Hymenobacter fodinae TaxID=2510796 RepID=A0A4Z0P9Y5_9BACT|nr:class I SAM-dependent methyltransferase [Hymenobacter fodinae]TGE09487.1 class I SAM-dependent methyltransferase [Hymenobacter fodinae]